VVETGYCRYNALMKFSLIPFLLVAALPLSVSLLTPSSNNQVIKTKTIKAVLFQASPYEVKPGGDLVLNGSGFSYSGNIVNFGSGAQVEATSSDSTTLNIKVPPTLFPGEYELSILGGQAVSNSKVYVKVTNNPRTPPIISKVIYSAGYLTIIGDGFSSSNALVTSLGTLSNVSSFDGKTITFRANDLSDYSRIKKQLAGRQVQTVLWIQVSNDRGTSKEAYKLDVRL
jgi:hypothetical protein